MITMLRIPAFTRVIVRRTLLLLGAYALARFTFLFWNWTLLFRGDSAGDLARAFAHGLRFDLSAIALTNAIGTLIVMLPRRWQNVRAVKVADGLVFAVVNVVCLGLNFVDAEFVKFVGKRSSVELLRMTADIRQQAFSLVTSYWYLALATAALAAALTYVLPRVRPNAPTDAWPAAVAWRLIVLGLSVLAIRGGFQFKPIHPMDAYFSTHHELGLLTLNTPFNLIKSPPRRATFHERYFTNDDEAARRLRELTDLGRPTLKIKPGANVVILLMESFATEYVGAANTYPGYTPFFDSLTKLPGARFFKRNFANARRSLEGVPAVFCGLPAMMEEPILTSDYSNNTFQCLPRALAEHGYDTWFLHGAHNGSMHFDTFSNIAGFRHFVGLNEYPKFDPLDLDPDWGVLDEPMLRYAVDIIDRAPKPVMMGVFTLSAHHPYFIPKHLRGKFPKGTLEIHESIGYSDYALEHFFAAARTKSWFTNTVFVITADHTQKSDHSEYTENELGFYRVPLLIYAPGAADQLPAPTPDRITQQIDIVPSVLDLIGLDQPNRALVGQSVFDQKVPGRAYNYTSWSYWYLDPDIYVDWGRPPYPSRAWTHSSTYSLKEIKPDGPVVERAVTNLKAIVHYMNEGLSRNTLFDWRAKYPSTH